MRSRKSRPLWWRVTEIVAVPLAVLLGLWLRAHVFQMGYVPSESMEPTLKTGDRVIIYKRAFRHTHPQRGDVIAFRQPDQGDLLVKRVIGLPGETIFVRNRHVEVNSRVLDEPYLMEPPQLEAPVLLRPNDKQVVVLGDNRNRSEDSRDFGPVPLKNVIGRVSYIVWPLGRIGRVH